MSLGRRTVPLPAPHRGADEHRSLWLREVLQDGAQQPQLAGSDHADVAIIGGGYVGLWTAIRIKERDPGCDVVVLEQDVCGGGASGRNGGLALSWWPKLATLVKLCGHEEAIRLGRASEAAIEEIRTFCEEHRIDCHFRSGGRLWTSTAAAQLAAWNGVLELSEQLGVDAFEPLDSREVAARSGSPVHVAGILEPGAATLHPAALARGLRRVALERGVRIFEQTAVKGFTRDRPLLIQAEHGQLAAEKLVIAANAWAAAVPELRRSLVVVSSDMVTTAPMPDRLEEIGWTGGEGITDSQLMVNYYRTTPDGRIAFGKGTAELTYGGRVGRTFDHSERRAAMVIDEFRRTYPDLADAALADHWGGPVDRTPTGLPIFGHLGGRDHIVYGVGWSGNGVAPSLLGGRILSSLVLDVDDEWSRSSLVDRHRHRFPPEPVRYLGGQLVRRAVMRKQAAERSASRPGAFTVRLAKLASPRVQAKRDRP